MEVRIVDFDDGLSVDQKITTVVTGKTLPEYPVPTPPVPSVHVEDPVVLLACWVQGLIAVGQQAMLVDRPTWRLKLDR